MYRPCVYLISSNPCTGLSGKWDANLSDSERCQTLHFAEKWRLQEYLAHKKTPTPLGPP